MFTTSTRSTVSSLDATQFTACVSSRSLLVMLIFVHTDSDVASKYRVKSPNIHVLECRELKASEVRRKSTRQFMVCLFLLSKVNFTRTPRLSSLFLTVLFVHHPGASSPHLLPSVPALSGKFTEIYPPIFLSNSCIFVSLLN